MVPHSLESNLLFFHTMLIIILAMTGRTQAEEDGGWIANIMVAVGCMQIDRVTFSCSSGFPLFPLRDMAPDTPFACLLLTLPGEDFPIFGILLSPFRFHIDSIW